MRPFEGLPVLDLTRVYARPFAIFRFVKFEPDIGRY